MNFGLLKVSWCYVDVPSSPCTTNSMSEAVGQSDLQCVKAGQGVIAAATFAMLFGLLSIIFLHIHTSFKQWCNCRVPMPRLFIALWSFLSLTLYIVAVATWYSQCHNELQDQPWIFPDTKKTATAESVTPGYAIALAVLVVVLSFLGWLFNFSRTCFPNKSEQVTGSTEYNRQSSTSNLGGGGLSVQAEGQKSNGDSETYGDEPAGGGYTAPSGGGYGGSYGVSGGGYGGGGGAYGGSSGGYGGSYGGAYGGSGGAYGGGNQSAYG